MNTDNAAITRCLSFINCQLTPGQAHRFRDHPRPAVTVSRQTGSGGYAVAEALAVLLQRELPGEQCQWTVFDRNLVEKVLEDHHLPARMARFMPEDRVTGLSDTMDELFDLHPPSETLVRQVSDTIYRLAELGNVILIGRGANVITARLPHVFHVRLVGSLDRRREYLQERGLDAKTALERIRTEDLGRKRYLHKYFRKDIDDPLLYNMVINTDRIPPPAGARLITQAMVESSVKAPAEPRGTLSS